MDAPPLTLVTHAQLVEGVLALADALAAAPPDLLVGIGRGGLAPAVYLSHAIGLPMVSLDRTGGASEVAAVASLTARTRAGARLLFVDDINDSGRTIVALRAELAEAGAAMDRVRFAVLIDNLRSAARVEFAARAIDRSTTPDWFLFPWEAVASRDVAEEEARLHQRRS